jgi:hypothetical protein
LLTEVTSGDVVTETDSALLMNEAIRDSEVERSRETATNVAEVVVTSPNVLVALRSVNAEGSSPNPLASTGDVVNGVNIGDEFALLLSDGDEACGTIGNTSIDPANRGNAAPALLDVLGLSQVGGATLRLVGQDGEITPLSGVPVRIIVTLLRALETTAFTVGVLASVDGAVAVELLVGVKQTLVALTVLAALIGSQALVTTEADISIAIPTNAVDWGNGDGI